MKYVFDRFVREQGQDLIEYALLACFISIASEVANTARGTSVQDRLNNVKQPRPAPVGSC